MRKWRELKTRSCALLLTLMVCTNTLHLTAFAETPIDKEAIVSELETEIDDLESQDGREAEDSEESKEAEDTKTEEAEDTSVEDEEAEGKTEDEEPADGSQAEPEDSEESSDAKEADQEESLEEKGETEETEAGNTDEATNGESSAEVAEAEGTKEEAIKEDVAEETTAEKAEEETEAESSEEEAAAESTEEAAKTEGSEEGTEAAGLEEKEEATEASEAEIVAANPAEAAIAQGTVMVDELLNEKEEIPGAVQAFLDAVAKIPEEITLENAEEAGELLYGEVADALEELLGTEDFEREDVQAACKKMEAAMKLVDKVLNMEISVLAFGYTPVTNVEIYPDRKPAGNTATGKTRNSGQSLTMKVGQKASFLLGAPTNTLIGSSCGHTIAVYNPSDYCDISLIDNSGQNLVGNPTYAAGNNKGTRVFDTVFEALKPGTSSDVRVCYYANFGIVLGNGASSGYVDCPRCWKLTLVYANTTWYRYNDVFGITVNADYRLNYDTRGGSSVLSTTKTVANTSCNLTVTSQVPVKEGYTFLGWSEAPNANTAKYKAGDSITLNWSEGYGSESNPVSKTLYAVWEEVKTPEAPKAPERTDLSGILGNKFVKVVCISEGQNLPHGEKYYSTVGNFKEVTVGAVENEGTDYFCTLTLHGDIYAQFYGFESPIGTGVSHQLDRTETKDKTLKLKWNPDSKKWGAADAIPVEFKVRCVTSANYTVKWFDADGKEIKEATRTGEVGKEVSVAESDKVLEGYTFDENNSNNKLTDNVTADGSTELRLYFKKNEQPTKPATANYTVKWLDAEGKEIKEATRTGEVGKEVSVAESDKVLEGYTFDEDNSNNKLTDNVAEDGSTELRLYFKKNEQPTKPATANYTVKWLDAEGKEIKEATRTGEVGKEVSVAESDKVLEGYTFDEDNSNNKLTDNVAEDGSTELRLYFKKNEQPTEPSTDPTEPSTDPTEPSTDPTKPAETDPTKPAETDPTKPAETDPTKPAETDPTKPAETDPTKPAETDPTKPAETDPTKPAETDPSKPAETKPSESNPVETSPTESKPAETKPGESNPAGTTPGGNNPTETKPGENNPTGTTPGGTTPTEPTPGETKPAETEPAAKYTIIYTDGVADEEVFADQVYEVTSGDDTPAFEGTPTREGYRFVGWSPEVTDKVTKNATYRAQWEVITGNNTSGSTGGSGSSGSSGGGSGRGGRDVTSAAVIAAGTSSETTAAPAPEDNDTVTINPDDVPLAEAPSMEDEMADLTNIPDEEVPLAGMPKTGDRSMTMAGLAGMMMLSVLGMFEILRKRKEDAE